MVKIMIGANDKAKLKDREEVNLIADYEMEWGMEDHWPDYIVNEFNEKWDEIQRKYT